MHGLDQRLIIDVHSVECDRLDDVFRHDFVHVQHVQVNAAQLQDVGVTESLAGSYVCLEYAAQLLDGRHGLQVVHIGGSLRDDQIPYLVE